MKKKEMTRLINMVMLAEKTDPRITADKVTISIAHYLCLSHTSYINTLTHTLPLSLSLSLSLSETHILPLSLSLTLSHILSLSHTQQERKRQAKDAEKDAKEADSKNRVALDAASQVSGDYSSCIDSNSVNNPRIVPIS